MSQSTKRNAETAFEDSAEHKSPTRKKRHRQKKTKQEQVSRDGDSAPAQVSSVKSSTHTDKKASKSKLNGSRPSQVLQQSDVVSRQPEDLTMVKRSRKKNKHKKEVHSNEPGVTSNLIQSSTTQLNSWAISSATGGTLIDHDPVLTADGQYMVLLTKDHVNVYSTSTSLLVRSILVLENHTIAGCSLSLTSLNALFVATRQGSLVKLDITNGIKIAQWKVEMGIRKIISVNGNGSVDSVLAVRNVEARDDELLLLSFHVAEKAETKILLRQRRFIHSVRASADASYIVLCDPQGVHLGVRTSPEVTKYTWFVFGVPGTITSFDLRTSSASKRSSTKETMVDIVVGLRNGAIFVYEDALEKLSKQSKSGSRLDLSGRKLHWHRHSVQSVKWSRDGNYIISGGDETVLVIWQLETNQQQFLPHLSSTICNIVVSPSGAEYALRLGDNSVMILSTADLTPSTNVTGLSLPLQPYEKFPMQLHPTHSNQLLAAVPIRLGGQDQNQQATHLQVYDIDTNLQLSRQALTRNVTTVVNAAPDGQSVQEPGVTGMQISSDGNWLATLEKWSPNPIDMQALYLEEDQAAKDKAVETTLRFWQMDANQNMWDIVTRIDQPHAHGHSSVQCIASNPAALEFSTIGSDGSVNIWQPRKRVRDGIHVRNKAGRPLFSWTCARSIHVEKPHHENQTSAVLTYSEDGSMLIASWSSEQRYVHLIDRAAGRLSMSLPDLLSEGPAHLETSGRYLLCLSTDLRIVDMVTLQTTSTMDIKANAATFLTLNPQSNTFAIGINSQDGMPGAISIFDIEKPQQGSIVDFELPVQIHALLADSVSRGFVVIDNESKIRKITAPGSVATTSSALIPDGYEFNEPNKTFEDIFGHKRANIAGRQQELIEDGSGSKNLADLLSATSTAAQPGVGELFDLVSRAVAGAQVNVGA